MKVEKFLNKHFGWEKSLLFCNSYLYSIVPISSKQNGMFPVLSLLNSTIENSSEEDNVLSIKSINNQNETLLRCSTKTEKENLLKKLKELVDEANKELALSHEYTKVKLKTENEIKQSQIAGSHNLESKFEIMKNHYFLSVNCMKELNLQLSLLNNEIKEIPSNQRLKVDARLLNIFCVKDDLKSQLDLMMNHIIDYKFDNSNQSSEQEHLNIKKSILAQSQIFYSTIENEPDSHSEGNGSIFYSTIDHELITDNKSIISHDPNNNPKSISQTKLSFIAHDFNDPLYNFPKREYLSKRIKCNKSLSNYISTYEKSSSSSILIKCNEPISTLQKECERFIYSNLLTNAAETMDKEVKLCYIMGFIIAQHSLKINRILKPFTPIIGETFEYCDNQRGYRFFAEEVCHNPPISAFIGESDKWAFFGDSREENNFRLLKGAIEMEFSNKQHLLFKQTNDYYIFNKPSQNFRGIVVGTLRYNVVGKVLINNCNDSSIKGELEFYEDISKHANGDFEGKVVNNNEVKYLIKGNFNSYAYYCTPDGNNKVNIWNIIDDKYTDNTFKDYSIPSYSCNLNFYSDKLAESLPPTDTRFRPDIRSREEGDNDKALELRNQLLKKQNEMLKQYDNKKKLYQPAYFNEIYDQKSLDHVYVYKGGYWEDKAKKDYQKLNYQIFKFS